MTENEPTPPAEPERDASLADGIFRSADDDHPIFNPHDLIHLAHLTIDTRTGEQHKGAAIAQMMALEIAQLNRELTGKRLKISKLETDLDAKARKHPAWNGIERLHAFWREECKHPRVKFGSDDFWEALSLWERYGEETCKRAIRGAAFDPFTVKMRNGRHERKDGWDLIFRNNSKFISFVNRAPLSQGSLDTGSA